jgi:hypothetical protein
MKMANAKQRRNDLRTHSFTLKFVIDGLGAWNPAQPNYKMLNETNPAHLKELADLYWLVIPRNEKAFVSGVWRQKYPMSNKQKFRLITVLSECQRCQQKITQHQQGLRE